jgi:DNA-binding XRE family transcriptional regulator
MTRASQLLSAWRRENKLSQGAAAEMLGVRQPTWSEYEIGRKIPRTTTALEIARMTGGAVPIEAWGEPAAEAPDATPVPGTIAQLDPEQGAVEPPPESAGKGTAA